MNKMIARMICLMLALIMTLCAAMPVLAEGDTGSETATDADSLADALDLPMRSANCLPNSTRRKRCISRTAICR